MRIIIAMMMLSPVISSAGELWGAINLTSYHVNAHRNYNSRNFGGGLEYQLTDDIALMAGAYRNSFDKESAYALASYSPIPMLGARLGIAAGTVTGYSGRNHGHAAPAIAVILRMEGERVGANIMVMPPVTDHSPLTIGLQVKLKF